MSLTKPNNESKPNILIPISLLVLFGGLVFILPCPSDSQFIYFKLVLAIIAGLFGWFLSGFINITATWGKLVINATGGFGLFFLVFFYSPKLSSNSGKCAPQYTIILRDSTGKTIRGLEGKLSVIVGTDVKTPEIKSDGTVDVKGITEDKETTKFSVELLNEDWLFKSNREKVIDTFFKNERLVLYLVLDNQYCCLKGTVVDASNNNTPMENVEVFVDNIKIITNKEGKYDYIVPNNLRKTSLNLRISKDSFITIEKVVSTSLKVDETIYLHRTNRKE